MKSINELSEIIPGIYLSSYKVATNVEKLRNYGISHVITFMSKSKPFKDDVKLNIFYFKLKDNTNSSIWEHIEEFHQILVLCLEKKWPVLVHCRMGISRSPTMLMTFLMKYKRIPLLDCLKLVRSKRPIVHPNEGFWQQLSIYEKKKGLLSTSTTPRERRRRLKMSEKNKKEDTFFDRSKKCLVKIGGISRGALLFELEDCFAEYDVFEVEEEEESDEKPGKNPYDLILGNGLICEKSSGGIGILTTLHFFDCENKTGNVPGMSFEKLPFRESDYIKVHLESSESSGSSSSEIDEKEESESEFSSCSTYRKIPSVKGFNEPPRFHEHIETPNANLSSSREEIISLRNKIAYQLSSIVVEGTHNSFKRYEFVVEEIPYMILILYKQRNMNNDYDKMELLELIKSKFSDIFKKLKKDNPNIEKLENEENHIKAGFNFKKYENDKLSFYFEYLPEVVVIPLRYTFMYLVKTSSCLIVTGNDKETGYFRFPFNTKKEFKIFNEIPEIEIDLWSNNVNWKTEEKGFVIGSGGDFDEIPESLDACIGYSTNLFKDDLNFFFNEFAFGDLKKFGLTIEENILKNFEIFKKQEFCMLKTFENIKVYLLEKLDEIRMNFENYAGLKIFKYFPRKFQELIPIYISKIIEYFKKLVDFSFEFVEKYKKFINIIYNQDKDEIDGEEEIKNFYLFCEILDEYLIVIREKEVFMKNVFCNFEIAMDRVKICLRDPRIIMLKDEELEKRKEISNLFLKILGGKKILITQTQEKQGEEENICSYSILEVLQKLAIIRIWFGKKFNLRSLFCEYLASKTNSGKLYEPDIVPTTVFPFNINLKKNSDVGENSKTCCGFSGSMVILERNIEKMKNEKKLVVSGLISSYKPNKATRKLEGYMLFFPSYEFSKFWKRVKRKKFAFKSGSEEKQVLLKDKKKFSNEFGFTPIMKYYNEKPCCVVGDSFDVEVKFHILGTKTDNYTEIKDISESKVKLGKDVLLPFFTGKKSMKFHVTFENVGRNYFTVHHWNLIRFREVLVGSSNISEFHSKIMISCNEIEKKEFEGGNKISIYVTPRNEYNFDLPFECILENNFNVSVLVYEKDSNKKLYVHFVEIGKVGKSSCGKKIRIMDLEVDKFHVNCNSSKCYGLVVSFIGINPRFLKKDFFVI